MMRKIATYGSLRKGLGNNRLLTHSTKISTEIVDIPFRMVSLGGFPGLVPSSEIHSITIEIYEVSPSTYRNVEYLEGYPSFYQKAMIETSEGKVEVYILESSQYQTLEPVSSGDWIKHIKVAV